MCPLGLFFDAARYLVTPVKGEHNGESVIPTTGLRFTKVP